MTVGHVDPIGKIVVGDNRSVHQAIDRHISHSVHVRAVTPRLNPLIDVSYVAQAALDAWLVTDTPTENHYDERIGHDFGDVDLSGLPYVGEPEINLHGIYTFGPLLWDGGESKWGGFVAASVFPSAIDNSVVAVHPYFVDVGCDVLYHWGVAALITPDLHLIPVGNDPRSIAADLDLAARASTYAVMASAVVLIANSIANGDPRLVKVKPTPEKVLRQARRKGRAVIDRTVVIELPGVKYDGKKWSGNRGDGVAWHMVRGHWRRLDDDRRTWVRPHSRGNASLGGTQRIYRVRTP